MRSDVLVDSGPLVALFDRSDRDHERARLTLARLDRVALVTTEAVVTEASYLLARSPPLAVAMQRWLGSGRIDLEPIDVDDRGPLADLMVKYASLPMDYADATVVRVAARRGTVRVWTIDRRDFSVYRAGRAAFELIS